MSEKGIRAFPILAWFKKYGIWKLKNALFLNYNKNSKKKTIIEFEQSINWEKLWYFFISLTFLHICEI